MHEVQQLRMSFGGQLLLPVETVPHVFLAHHAQAR